MKTRKSQAHLVMSSCHFGMSEDILKVFSTVAQYFKAKTYHLGALMSSVEQKSFSSLKSKLSAASEKLDNLSDDAKDTTVEKLEDTVSGLQTELELLSKTARGRISSLTGHFKGMTLVVPSRDHVPSGTNLNGGVIAESGLSLCRYLYLSGFQLVSDASTLRPTNRKVIHFLKQHGQKYSWLAPHPVPVTLSYPRPGLNNTHSYITVGALKHVTRPTCREDITEASYAPSAVLVLEDKEDGSFHAVHLHIDYQEKRGFSRKRPVVLYDGLCFSTSGASEVKSSDRAVFETDDHEPDTHPGTLGAVRQLIQLFRPETFINGGDASTCEPVNRHEEGLRGKQEGRRISEMLKGLKALLTAQTDCDSIKTRILLDSNHHEWLSRYVDKNPELKGLLDWETLQRTIFTDWNFFLRQSGFVKPYMFGDYTLRHGDQERFDRAELIYNDGKYLCGHWHHHQEIRRAISQGCGGELDPAYTENQVNGWQNQISTLTRSEGVTAVAVKILLHDEGKKKTRFAYRGEIIEVSFFQLKY